jgi:hypothetical protein
VQKITAAYTDPSVAPTVVADLVGAGMKEAEVTVMSPWPVTGAPNPVRHRLPDRLLTASLATALVMGGVLWVVAWLWADPGRWVYGLLGLILGALTGSMARALAATSPPDWHECLLGDPLGAVTVEVSTTDGESAEVARSVMAVHEPALVEATTEPGPRQPVEHVLWDHEEGLSPLEELSSWVSGRDARVQEPPRQRGRHLEPGRARG